MKRKMIYTEGITGMTVTFNHSELVVLKGLQGSLQSAIAEKENSDADNTELLSALRPAEALLENILPEEVMSIHEAEVSLFAVEDPELKENIEA